MRPGNQNNKRMRGRGRKAPNPLTRTYESNGPDVKIRGTAMHIAEKYQQLARDAQASGDRIVSENYLQHAEHYSRIVAAAQPQQNQQASNNNASPRSEDENNAPQAANGHDQAAATSKAKSSDASEDQGQPVIGLDTPQPYIEDHDGGAVGDQKKVNPEGDATPAMSSSDQGTDEDGASADDKPKRRTRGTRGRGVRRTSAAPVAALPEESDNSEAPAESSGDGEQSAEATDADAAPKAKRTPRVRTPRVPRSPRTTRARRTKATDADAAPAAEATEGAEG
ncbi:DUF4167 domain-containing protein [Pseudovibrio exalbescens]|uniref:DUF4167 domain-containing protein n=1 Tax=Pseudovibrio exalbescens TaxID=197461 RepID=UPI000C99DE96